MPCTKLPTGPCTKVANGPCLAPAVPGALAPLTGVHIQGHDDGFTVTWDTATGYPDQAVMLITRNRAGAPVEERILVERNIGAITAALVLIQNNIYKVMLRPFTISEHGAWQEYLAYISAAWSSDSELIQHLGQYVFHGTDAVIID